MWNNWDSFWVRIVLRCSDVMRVLGEEVLVVFEMCDIEVVLVFYELVIRLYNVLRYDIFFQGLEEW